MYDVHNKLYNVAAKTLVWMNNNFLGRQNVFCQRRGQNQLEFGPSRSDKELNTKDRSKNLELILLKCKSDAEDIPQAVLQAAPLR